MRRAVAKAIPRNAVAPDARSIGQRFFADAPQIRDLAQLTSRFSDAARTEGVTRHLCVAAPEPHLIIALYGDAPELVGAFAAGAPLHSIHIESWSGDFVELLLETAMLPVEKDRAARLHLLAVMYATCAEALLEKGSDIETAHPASQPLSVNERLCLGLLLTGYSDAMISERLDCGILAVDLHIADAIEKLGVKSRIEAVDLAARRGWLLAETLSDWKLVYIKVN